MAPSFIVLLELEAEPKIIVNCLDEGEEMRLRWWADQHSQVRSILDLATGPVAIAGTA